MLASLCSSASPSARAMLCARSHPLVLTSAQRRFMHVLSSRCCAPQHAQRRQQQQAPTSPPPSQLHSLRAFSTDFAARHAQVTHSNASNSCEMSQASKKVEQPAWHRPQGIVTPIKITNSLTQQKDDFIISDAQTRTITWYTCGPTVYDKSHMGHARTYVGFDIVRRIVEDYFQYNVMYIINVTDVDDKIIKKANRVLLVKLAGLLDAAVAQGASAGVTIPQEFLQCLAEAKDRLDADEKTKERAKQLTTPQIVELASRLRELARTHLLPLKQLGVTREQIDEKADFVGVARHNEDLFWRDMKNLQVRYPSVVTRVTEYAPQIVDYIQKIIANGYAYESNGSVYFDVTRFKQSTTHRHDYGKLEPWSVNDAEKAAEGEGEWASTNASSVQTEKHGGQDFALWKKSKEGEPAWPSPWGMGRPGWHIECSAMASHVVGGPRLDVHCGGIDLRFPHHDNELAQSEAHFECSQWVNYFMHAGHLHIEGMSMSKSKKNFITISDALTEYNSRQIRMLFLLRKFDDALDYSKESMDGAIQKERFFNEFFQNVKAALREADAAFGRSEVWQQAEFDLHGKLLKTRAKVHDALCDSFDTPTVLNLLQELVFDTNRYLVQAGPSKSAKAPLLRAVATYVTHIFRVFGLIDSIDAVGFPAGAGAAGGEGQQGGEAAVAPFLDALSAFRDKVRESARAKKDHKEILQLCDQIRDDVLPELGVRLEDRTPGEPAVWKLEDKQVLLMERERARQEQLEKQLAKDEAKRKKDEEERKKLEEGKLSPADMFRASTEPRYTQFDAEGLPTHVSNAQTGAEEEVSKSQRKNLKKAQDRQAKLHAQYLAYVAKSAASASGDN